MRIVAKVQFLAVTNDISIRDRLVNIVEEWADNKFIKVPNGSLRIRSSNLEALFERRTDVLKESTQDAFTIIEPISGGQLQTQLKLLFGGGTIRLQCVMSFGSDGAYQIPKIDIRSPRFIREMINIGISLGLNWTVGDGGERIFAKCFNVDAPDLVSFIDLLKAKQRRLPLVVISDFQDRTIAGDIHERIGADVCGLAHACRLTGSASWALTELLGKEWSCYNGAIRLFWPFYVNQESARTHPLWTLDRLLRISDNESIARDRFRQELMESLTEASTFVADDKEFRLFETSIATKTREERHARVEETGDFQSLAELYAVENSQLTNSLAQKISEIETLQQNVEALSIALRAETTVTKYSPTEQTPPASVCEAISAAQHSLAEWLLFSTDIFESAATLNSAAGPPEKIYRYLETLADLSMALGSGSPLGRSIPVWLKERNVECSGESESIRNNKVAKQRRTFFLDGRPTYCEFHAKPTDEVSPDHCVRIYFIASSQKPYIQIGYLGRHFD